jgi:hypothetical protein
VSEPAKDEEMDVVDVEDFDELAELASGER